MSSQHQELTNVLEQIMWAAALSLIQKHGRAAADWASEQAASLRAAGDVKGGIIFECLRDCVERLQSRPQPLLH